MSWCFEDEVDAYTERVLASCAQSKALVPSVWSLEVANVLAIAERRKRLTPTESARFLELLGELAIEHADVPFTRATGSVLTLARELGLSSYDAAYLDLAVRSSLPLATRDRKLMAACRRSGVERFAPGARG
jgi:predicted nucleic acid-binding protein